LLSELNIYMAYGNDIDGLGADHRWDLDGNANDSIGTATGTNAGGIFTGPALTKDATNSWEGNNFTDRVTLPTVTTINNSAQARKAVCGWVEFTEFSPHPVRIYGEGTNTTCFQFCMGYGNNLTFECTEPTNFATGLQIFGPPLVPNRVYHICGIFLGNAQGNEIKLFVDGIEYTNADPLDRQPNTASLDSRGVGVFGDPAGTTGLGGAVIIQQCVTNGRYQHWAAWGDEADANLTDSEIRDTLFERGALADFSIPSSLEATMQISLDAIADAQGDAPCCIEIEAVTGGGDFTLTSDKTFDPLASIHYRYNGTAGELTIVNIDDTQQGNASIGSAPFGGSIVIATRQTLTVTVKDAADFSAISGARVYIEADTGGDLVAGTEIMNTTTNVSGLATVSHDYTTDQPIIARVRKGSTSTYYKENIIGGPLTSTALNETVLLVPDE